MQLQDIFLKLPRQGVERSTILQQPMKRSIFPHLPAHQFIFVLTLGSYYIIYFFHKSLYQVLQIIRAKVWNQVAVFIHWHFTYKKLTLLIVNSKQCLFTVTLKCVHIKHASIIKWIRFLTGSRPYFNHNHSTVNYSGALYYPSNNTNF